MSELADQLEQRHGVTVELLSADQVVAGALRAYDRGKVTYVPGVMNKLGALGSWFGPSALARKVAGFVQKRWARN